MNTQTVFRYRDWDCVPVFNSYSAGGMPSISLVGADTKHNVSVGVEPGEPIAMATVNIPEIAAMLGSNQTLIKNYSENQGMIDALVNAGVVEEVGPAPYHVDVRIANIVSQD